jgi:hypothetical protein
VVSCIGNGARAAGGTNGTFGGAAGGNCAAGFLAAREGTAGAVGGRGVLAAGVTSGAFTSTCSGKGSSSVPTPRTTAAATMMYPNLRGTLASDRARQRSPNPYGKHLPAPGRNPSPVRQQAGQFSVMFGIPTA